MIELYTWSTPNGRKVSVMLEECALAYNLRKINIGAGDQFAPDYLAINPNGKIPSIVDPDGPDGKPIRMMESGAILIYLSAKTGKFLPKTDRGKYVALQWLMFQMGHIGPMFGQVHHFLRSTKEPVLYAIERYTKEKDRLYGVLDRRLGEAEYLAGEYSIADIATYPWVARHEHRHLSLGRAPRVAQDRLERLSQRETLVRRDRCETAGQARDGGSVLMGTVSWRSDRSGGQFNALRSMRRPALPWGPVSRTVTLYKLSA